MVGLRLPFSHNSTQSLSKSWEYWSTSIQLGPACSGGQVGRITEWQEKNLLPTSIKEKGKCSGKGGNCTAEKETSIPKWCVNGLRSIFPNRTEVWGWLSFCSSKQPFQPLFLQDYECPLLPHASQAWSGQLGWSGEAEAKYCMLSAIRMAAREPVEVVPGMRLEYHQGWRRQSQVSTWLSVQKAVQVTSDPNQFIQIEGIELGSNIYLYLPLLLICTPSSCQATLHTDPS